MEESASHARREKREKKLTPASVPSSRVTHNSRSPPFTKKRKKTNYSCSAGYFSCPREIPENIGFKLGQQ